MVVEPGVWRRALIGPPVVLNSIHLEKFTERRRPSKVAIVLD
jgi:hypothetical protein